MKTTVIDLYCFESTGLVKIYLQKHVLHAVAFQSRRCFAIFSSAKSILFWEWNRDVVFEMFHFSVFYESRAVISILKRIQN